MKYLKLTIIAAFMLIFASEVAFTQNISITRYPYIQKPTTNSVLIAWKTDSLSNSRVEYGLLPSLGSVVTDTTLIELHGIGITGLESNTTYYYRVSSQLASGAADSSEVETFHTNNDTLNPSFDFMIFGDMGDGGPAQFALRNRILTLDFDLAILTGDIVYDHGERRNFDPRHFVPFRDIIKNTAFFPSPGNHDQETEDGAPYIDNFFLPNNNPDSTEFYYSFDYGRTHFISLDLVVVQQGVHAVKFDTSSTQYAWLISDLEAASTWADFIIPYFHHPPYSSNRSYPRIQDTIVPLLEKYQVEIVFAGHDHYYERWFPINGVTHLVTGGGGRGLDNVRSLPGIAYGESAHHVTLASIRDKTLSFKMVRTDGAVRDSATVISSKLIVVGNTQEEHTSHEISVVAHFDRDRNRNASALLEHKLSSESAWTNDGLMGREDKRFTAAISNLSQNTEYDIRLTFVDLDGIVGDSIQTIANILTTPFFTNPAAIFASFSPSSILVTADFFGDGNNNATAALEHKLSSETVWIDDGPMTRDASQPRFTLSIEDINVDENYDFRVTYSDPDGIEGRNPFLQTEFRNVLQIHPTSINIDGNLDDWLGIPPTEADTWVMEDLAKEFIWKDAEGDDLGDGGDAPNASDNPAPYSYPAGASFVGTEGDIEEFRVAYDENNFYFLVDMVGSAKVFTVPFSIILVDKDGADSGNQSVESRTDVQLGVNHAWDYKIEINNQRITITDAFGVDVSSGARVAQVLEGDFSEISVPISILGTPVGTWSFAVLQTVARVNRVVEINFAATNTRGGGGIDGDTDPDIFDLVGAKGEDQYADLNNYTDSTFAVITNSWLEVSFPGDPTSVQEPSPDLTRLPEKFQLFQNYPNPFNPQTTIEYSLAGSGRVLIEIYNILGQKVTTLVDNYHERGFYKVQWQGKDNSGRNIASGVYIYKIKSGDFAQTKKLLLLR